MLTAKGVSARLYFMDNIKVVIHDWDDTATASYGTYKKAHRRFAEYHGLNPPTEEKIKQHWGKTILDLYYYIHGIDDGFSLDEIKNMLSEYSKANTLEYIPPIFEGVNETILYLKNNYVLGVLSSGNLDKITSLISLHLDENAVQAYKFILCAQNCKVHKPNPKVFDHAMEHLKDNGILEENVLYVGDSLLDYYAARDRGMPFVAVTTGLVSKRDFLEIGLDENMILKKFSDLQNLL